MKRACGMFAWDPGPEDKTDPPLCGKPARRIMRGGSPTEGCCDTCFADMLACDDFTRAELDSEYPIDPEIPR